MAASKPKKALFTLLSVIFWIAVWQAAAMLIDSSLILPSPVKTLVTLVTVASGAEFWLISLHSLLRIFSGAFAGVAIGSLLAFFGYRSVVARYLIAPLMTTVKATPIASFIILFLILIGKTPVPALTSALIAVPIMYANVFKGFESVDVSLSEVCRVYAFSPLTRFRVLTLPSVKPFFVSGLKSCIGLAWKAGIAAEVLCTPAESIGLKIHETRIYLQTPELFAWTVTVVMLSLVFEKLTVNLISGDKRRDRQ